MGPRQRAHTKRRLPVWLGNTVGVGGLLVGILVLVQVPKTEIPFVQVALALLSWFCFIFFSHCLTHYIVGTLLGIRFRHYFIGRTGLAKLDLPIVSAVTQRILLLGLKIDEASLKEVGRTSKVAMYSSGTLASMLLPWIVPAYAMKWGTVWLTAILSALSLGNVAVTLYFSPKVGDLSRALRQY